MHVFTTSVDETKIQTDMSVATGGFVWTGFSDESNEGIYLSPYGLNINSTILNWIWGEPNGKHMENCALFPDKKSTQVVDSSCEHSQNIACDIEQELLFSIHNIQDIFPQYSEMEIIIDVEFTEKNNKVQKTNLEFRSFDGSRIIHNTKSNTWSLVSANGYTLLTISSKRFPIGNKQWNYCSGGQVEIVFNACGKEEFGCGNGICLPMYNRCNKRIDCPSGNPLNNKDDTSMISIE